MSNKPRSIGQKLLAAPHILWSVLFIIAPLVMVVYYSFTDRDGNFTFSNFSRFPDLNYAEILFRSVVFALIATVICLLIGYPVAYIISQARPRAQNILVLMIMLPMWMNFLLRTYSWMTILDDMGIINRFLEAIGIGKLHLMPSNGAVILGMVYNFLPFMILPIYSVMTKMDKSVIEASEDLGCNRLNVLMKVIIPMSRSGIVSGITMVFVPSISTFYITQKLGGGTFFLIGDLIEEQFRANRNLGAALSLVLMVIILVSLAVMRKYTDEEDNGGGMLL